MSHRDCSLSALVEFVPAVHVGVDHLRKECQPDLNIRLVLRQTKREIY